MSTPSDSYLSHKKSLPQGIGEAVEYSISLASQILIWAPLRVFFFFLGRLEVRGWENIGRINSHSFLIISNHTSYLDHFLISHIFPFGITYFPFRYPADPEHYLTWKMPFMWALGAYPIFKGLGLEKSLEKSLRILHAGGRILLYPEGRIKRYGRRKHARRGVAYLASRAGVPILPCRISGFKPLDHESGFRWRDILLRHYRLQIAIGEPFLIAEVFGKIPETEDEYRCAAEKAMERVYALPNGSIF